MPCRRSLLASMASAAALGLGGCSFVDDSNSSTRPVTLDAVDVLNRRSTTRSYQIAVQRDDRTVLARSRTIDGTDNSSQPTGQMFEDWPDERAEYEFALKIDSEEVWLRTTPSALNVREEGADCVRAVFVINLGGRLTAHARRPCAGL